MASTTPLTKSDSSMPKLVFVNRFYAPDLSATSQILTDVAAAMAAKEHKVLVVTSRMSYDAQETYPKSETISGVDIHRVWSTQFGRDNTVGRAIDYITFYLSVSISLLFVLSKRDTLVSKTDPPLLSIPLGLIARVKRANMVNWLQDIFPEVAFELGLGKSDSVLMRTLKQLRNRSLSRARMNVAIGERMSETIMGFGIKESCVHVIENFVDDVAITPRTDHAPSLRTQWEIDEHDFVVGYSGNLGRAHDLSTILAAATLLERESDIKFLFVGGGYLHAQLQEQIQSRGLNNIILQPYQPRERLPESLAAANLHWASLNPKLEGFIVPSKVYGIAAAGRPLLMIGDKDGEIGRMIAQYEFGACHAPGDAESVARFILDCKAAPQKIRMMGDNARLLIDDRANKALALKKWDDLCRTIASIR